MNALVMLVEFKARKQARSQWRIQILFDASLKQDREVFVLIVEVS